MHLFLYFQEEASFWLLQVFRVALRPNVYAWFSQRLVSWKSGLLKISQVGTKSMITNFWKEKPSFLKEWKKRKCSSEISLKVRENGSKLNIFQRKYNLKIEIN